MAYTTATAVSILLSFASTLGVTTERARGDAAPGFGRQATGNERIALEGVRFWREGGTTLVEGVVHLEGAPSWAASDDVVELAVRDEGGAQIYSERWTPELWHSIARLNPGVPWEIAEPFRVGLSSGRYTVIARIGAENGVASAEMDIEAFESRPLLSDLLVSGSVRVLTEGEEPGVGEIRKGPYAIRRSGRVVLTPQHPDLWYYVEVYAPDRTGLEAELGFSVWGEGAATPIAKVRRSVEVTGTSLIQAARIDLAGLPAGQYRLVLDVMTSRGGVRREAAFRMADMQTEALAAVALRASTQPTAETRLAERYFHPTVRGDSAIDVLIRALELVPPAGSVPKYVKEFDTEAKRRFLVKYWTGLDPDPTTPTNELLDDYLRRLDFVVREYSELSPVRFGIETDRGLVYLEYGPPDVEIDRPLTNDRAVEAWRYMQQRDLRFIFVDDAMGQYRLVYTTDPNKPSLPDWTARIGDDDLIREIFSY